MEREQIIALLKRVQNVCPPECKVEIVPTKQKEIYLIIVQFPSAEINGNVCVKNEKLRAVMAKNPALKSAYLWEKQKIHNLHYEIMLPTLNDDIRFRTIYCCGSKFVFYAHTFGFFEGHANIFDYVGIRENDEDMYTYVGSCRNTDLLIGYMVSTFEKL
ncbi:MAG: hypothetical protein IJS88_04215 [Alphaproteobacteria bacterium]|nr:hypothetical protein [Alphaproteobacteria bacterium]